MKAKRILLVLASLLLALFVTCGFAFASQAVVDSNFNHYGHQERFDNCIIIDGIDVSAWQDEINWSKVKRQGIDYALIRIGYTGLDDPFTRRTDKCFEQNYKEAKEAGLLVGVYYYSCATTEAEARKEASYVLNKLDGRSLDLPVIFDFEYAGRIKTHYVNKSTTTDTILAFLNYIRKNSDYEAMFYSYRSIMDPEWKPKFYMNKINTKYRVWIAQYSDDINSYTAPFEFWQYTSSGRISGIDGRVDCNFWYFNEENYPAAEDKKSIKDADISLSRSNYIYSTYQKKPKVTVTYEGKTLTEGKSYKKFYIKNVNAGTAYVMLQGIGNYSGTTVAPYNIEPISFKDNCSFSTISTQTYTGSKIKPSITVTHNGKELKKYIDYSISYKNNIEAGTATVTLKGKRNFTGTVTKTFTIKKKNIKNLTPSFQYKYVSYTGKERIQKVILDGLTEGVDYTVTYSNATKVGTVTATVTGINNCYGTTTGTYKIRLKSPKNVKTRLRKNATKGYDDVRISWDPVTGATSYRVYYKRSTDSSWKYTTVSGNKTTHKFLYRLTDGKKYNFKVVACCSRGNSRDSDIVSRRIMKKVTQNNAKTYSRKNSKIKLRWENIPGETGYEISQSRRKYGTNVIATVKSTSADSKVLTVKKGKTYYYKVRAYRLVEGVRVYAPWSNIKSYKLQ